MNENFIGKFIKHFPLNQPISDYLDDACVYRCASLYSRFFFASMYKEQNKFNVKPKQSQCDGNSTVGKFVFPSTISIGMRNIHFTKFTNRNVCFSFIIISFRGY